MMSFSGGGSRASNNKEVDRRYHVKILLVTDERPRYWQFHCMRCGLIVCELSGQVVAAADIANSANLPDYHAAPPLIQCTRSTCRIVYEFEALSGR